MESAEKAAEEEIRLLTDRCKALGNGGVPQ